MRSFLQLGLVLLAAACVHCETVFQRPPGPGPNRDYRDDPIYELGQEIDLIWEMDFEEASIVIWQQDVNKIFGDKSYYAEVIRKLALKLPRLGDTNDSLGRKHKVDEIHLEDHLRWLLRRSRSNTEQRLLLPVV